MAINYDAAAKKFTQQKAALTRAINSGNPQKVRAAVSKAVTAWCEDEDFGGAWPDDCARWQRALDDAYPWPHPQTDIGDLLRAL